MSPNLALIGCLAYAALLFGIAAVADRAARRGRLTWLRSPLVYTLSLSVYCTTWTYYGAVGSAARSGLEFLTIYLGPTLIFVAWWWLPRRIARIVRTQRITSIADLVSSRYGKSPAIAVAVTLIAVTAATPYIALQLQSLSASYAAIAGQAGPNVALFAALGLALFALLFGTRSVAAHERHHGIVTAIAFEAIVKLISILAVGVFVVWGVAGSPAGAFQGMPPDRFELPEASRWATLTILSAGAILTLPRMFQVAFVENRDDRQLALASWAFPLYLVLMSLFVVPIAATGLRTMPDANPDLYVLSIPLAFDQGALALLVFFGGFSAATAMVVISTIALATMVSNHVVMPLWLRASGSEVQAGDVRSVLLASRRAAIVAILAMGYVYYSVSAGTPLASIGLIAFTGVAQILPALLLGLLWRAATRRGALAGLAVGSAVWVWTLLLPSFGVAPLPGTLLDPGALFGLAGWDPVVHAALWSLTLNTGVLVAVSLATLPTPLERLQGAQFVNVFQETEGGRALRRAATSEDLFALAQRILGADRAGRIFREAAADQGIGFGLPQPTDAFVTALERELAGTAGAATAHAMVSKISGAGHVSVDDLIVMAGETAQIVEARTRLEETAAQLREANARLRRLSDEKDAFLSQVSHELRTPMTSIRSFAEILRGADVDPDQRARFTAIIHEEAIRLTRLLDEILDLSVLESGRRTLSLAPVPLARVVARAADATEVARRDAGVALEVRDVDLWVWADEDRLAQVLINLITNAVRYGRAEAPRIAISASAGAPVRIDVADNGPGIAPADAERVFEKFTRLGDAAVAGSAGLGLPISREIMRRLGGDLVLVPGGGARFRLTLKRAEVSRAAE